MKDYLNTLSELEQAVMGAFALACELDDRRLNGVMPEFKDDDYNELAMQKIEDIWRYMEFVSASIRPLHTHHEQVCESK